MVASCAVNFISFPPSNLKPNSRASGLCRTRDSEPAGATTGTFQIRPPIENEQVERLPSFLQALGNFYLAETGRFFRFYRKLLIRCQPRISLQKWLHVLYQLLAGRSCTPSFGIYCVFITMVVNWD